jgi:ribosomal protein S18 acetylase RimI-like enzyme
MEVRVASADDCRAIAEVHVASWKAAYTGILDDAFLANLSIDRREDMWRQTLAESASELLVASDQSSIVGFVSFGNSRDADAAPDRGELWALYVRPSAWSTGVGRELWHAAHTRMLERGFASVSLWVLQQNARAIRFYSVAGFKLEHGSEKKFELGGRAIAEVRMVHAG